MFGHGGPEYTHIVVSDQLLEVDNNHTVRIPNFHGVTETVGHSLYAVYNAVSLIILVNLLIAMMTHSYEKVQVCAIT